MTIKTHLLHPEAIETRDGLHLPSDGRGVWVEVVDPSAEDHTRLRDEVGIHEISLRAVLRAAHPPKFAEYDRGLMVIAHTPIPDDDGRPRKIAMFLGKNIVVTILRKALPTFQFSMKRLRERHAAEIQNPALVAYFLLDEMTAGFEGLGDSMFDRLNQVEDAIETDRGEGAMTTILNYRKDLQSLVRVVRRQRDVVQALSRTKHPAVEEKFRPYFRDSADYLSRVYDLLDSARDGVMAVRDGYLAIVNNRLSETMRVLTVIATIMMPLSLIAGIYGMNVGWLPAAGNQTTSETFGFWLVMGLMAAITLGMLAWFRKRKWI